MKTLSFLLLTISLLTTGCVGPGRSPHSFMPPIAEEYFVCEKCGSLHGGIYGKGPLASFSKDKAEDCWHRWSQISKATFQKKAAAEFPDQWKDSSVFFTELKY